MNRVFNVANLGLFLLGVLAIVIVLNFFSRQDEYRQRIDATKTRAYSLSQQTHQLLNDLQGRWKIAVVMEQKRGAQAMRRQIDEVLSRYTSASPNIEVVQIDPTRPETLIEYESLLAELTKVYRDSIAQYEAALNAALQRFVALQTFAQQRAATFEQLAAMLPEQDPLREPLRQRAGLLALLPDQGQQILAATERALRTDDSRPLPDFETARSVMAAALSQTAGDIDELAQLFAAFAQRPNLDEASRALFTSTQHECHEMSQQLATAADPLKHLPPLELSAIGAELQKGECAVIVGPNRAAMIPSAQLFPKSNFKKMDDGQTLFDQRFRGEQLISATIRSLTVAKMPRVIFVHSEDGPLLKPRDKQADVVGVANLLRASRFEVDEWIIAKQSNRPAAVKDQKTVWVIIPPAPARTLQPSREVQALADASAKLMEDGEAVLVNVSASLLSRYGQPDPFSLLGQPFGVTADTSQIVAEAVGGAASSAPPTLGQAIREFSPDHLIGRAVEGQQAYFGTPVPLRVTRVNNDAPSTIIASIQPSAERWLEREWTGDWSKRTRDLAQTLNEPVPLVVAAHRSHPLKAGEQRFMMVGSGGWMISNVADVMIDISGGAGRFALVHPGNHELMLASVAWLAGMDDLIAASPVGQEIARLRDITPQARERWMWIVVAGLPGLCAIVGIGVWMVRRN